MTIIYDCLARPRRRYVLYRLKEVAEPLALADLAADVTDWEAETARADISDETVKDVYMSLYHNYVQKLNEANLVEYDQERDTVELSEFPDVLGDGDQFLSAE